MAKLDPQQLAETVQTLHTSLPEAVNRVGIIFVLWGVSYTLQDISYIVSITAGLAGLVYTLHLLTKFWWELLWKNVFQRLKFYWINRVTWNKE